MKKNGQCEPSLESYVRIYKIGQYSFKNTYIYTYIYTYYSADNYVVHDVLLESPKPFKDLD